MYLKIENVPQFIAFMYSNGFEHAFSRDALRHIFIHMNSNINTKHLSCDCLRICQMYTESSIQEALKRFKIERIHDINQYVNVIHIDEGGIVYEEPNTSDNKNIVELHTKRG